MRLLLLLLLVTVKSYAQGAYGFTCVNGMQGCPTLSNPIRTNSLTMTGVAQMQSMNVSGSVIMGPGTGTITSGSILAVDSMGGLYFSSPTIGTLMSSAVWNVQSATHSITTSTGAAGWQVSALRNSEVFYNVTVTTNSQIGLVANVDGYVALEVAPTNSATPSDWIECGRARNGQALSIAVALGITQPLGFQLSCSVPSGYYAKLRSVNNNGTPTYTYVSGYEVLK